MTRSEARKWARKFAKSGWLFTTLHETLETGECYVTVTNACHNRREFDNVEEAASLFVAEPQRRTS